MTRPALALLLACACTSEPFLRALTAPDAGYVHAPALPAASVPRACLERTWFRDLDGDGYGDAAHTATACDQPPGYVARAGDCDDADPTIHPGAQPRCGVDAACDGSVPAGLGEQCWGGSIGMPLPYTARVAPCAPGVVACVPTVAQPVCVGAIYPSAPACGGPDTSCGTAPVPRAGQGDVLVLTESPAVEWDDTQRLQVAGMLLHWAAAHTTSSLRFALALYGDAAVDLAVPFGAPADVAAALLALAPGTQEGWETTAKALCWAATTAPWGAQDRTVLLVTEDGPDETLACSLAGYRVVALTDGSDIVAWAGAAQYVVNLDSMMPTLDAALAPAGCEP